MHNTGTVKVLDKLACIGALAPYADRFAGLCAKKGYSPRIVRDKYAFVADLSRRLKRRKLPMTALDEGQLSTFHALNSRRTSNGDPTTGRLMLRFLRDLSVNPAAPIDRSPLGKFIRDYERFLTSERRLSQGTALDQSRMARTFLTERFRDRPPRFQDFRSRDINRFLVGEAQRVSRSRAQQAAGALRPLLRFLQQRGLLERDLASAIPRVASWRLSRLPKFLPADQIKRLLKCSDRRTSVGQRDYAVLLLMARLGLRSGEIIAMTLEDFD